MKKRIIFFYIANCQLFVANYCFAQFGWKPVIDTTYGLNWYIDGGPVRVLYTDTIAFPLSPTLNIGGEFDTIRGTFYYPNGAWNPPILFMSATGHFYGYNCEPFIYFTTDSVYPASVWSFSSANNKNSSFQICGGTFNEATGCLYNNDVCNNIAGWSGGNSINSSFPFSSSSCPQIDTVYALAMLTDTIGNFSYSKIYAASRRPFCSSIYYIANYDLQKGPMLMQNGTNGPVYSIAAIDTSNVYAGGRFDSAGVIKANNIAKWNGAGWDSLGSGVNGVVKALLAYNGNIYAGGNFTMAGGVSANNIAVWDGVQWSAIGTGTNDTVYALTIHNGDLYAGGSFTQAGGNTVNYVAKWDGANWSALASGRNNEVYALASFMGDLYAGGNFLGGANDTARYIARYTDTTLTTGQSAIYNSQSEISIFPNPTNGKFRVQSSEFGIQSMEIYNVMGEKMYEAPILKDVKQIDVSLPSGMGQGIYFLHIKTGQGTANKKLIIQK